MGQFPRYILHSFSNNIYNNIYIRSSIRLYHEPSAWLFNKVIHYLINTASFRMKPWTDINLQARSESIRPLRDSSNPPVSLSLGLFLCCLVITILGMHTYLVADLAECHNQHLLQIVGRINIFTTRHLYSFIYNIKLFNKQ